MPTDPNSQDQDTALVLALDIGTSSIRAALYDERAEEVGVAGTRLLRGPLTTEDGGSEWDAEEALGHVALAIDELLSRAATLITSIEAVAISCFWHSLVGLDLQNRAVTPLYGWADTRSGAFVEELRRRFDETQTHERTGCRFHASYWPARFLWLRASRPAATEAAHRWMSFAEFLALRFFGTTEMSVSMASGTGLFNTHACTWDRELLEGLVVALEQLPAIAQADRAFKGLTDTYARRWPMLDDVPWFPAIGDGAASNIGVGCVESSRAALMIGTSGALRIMWKGEPPPRLPEELWCYRADRRRVLLGGALSDGGGLYAWMENVLAVGDDRDETLRAVAMMEPDAHGLTILPCWAGERSTGWHAFARGAILGLTLHTGATDILRAAMEAVAYRFALIALALSSVQTDFEIVATGGALYGSSLWTQIVADVLGRQVKLSSVREASSRGAVLLALEATGKIGRIEDAPARPTKAFEPDTARQERYRRALERQQLLYKQLIADERVARSIYEAAVDSNG